MRAAKRSAVAEAATPAPAAAPAAAPASSGGPTCGAAWRSAVEHQKSGQLQEARELFAACRQASCSPAMRKECSKQYDQLESDIPSVVAIVTDQAGEPRTDVEIKCDGRLLASQLDGRSVPVDPGVHEFSFSKDGDVFATQKVMVAEGQHHRLIAAAVPGAGGAESKRAEVNIVVPLASKKVAAPVAPKIKLASAREPEAAKPAVAQKDEDGDVATPIVTATAKEDSGKHIPATSYLLGGVGVLGIGGYGLLTYWGRKDNSMLTNCSPICLNSNSDHVKKLYLGADISLGVGIAALAGSYLVYTLSHNNAANKEEMATEQAYVLDVRASSSGAVASFSGSF